jgi:hypothetical protein
MTVQVERHVSSLWPKSNSGHLQPLFSESRIVQTYKLKDKHTDTDRQTDTHTHTHSLTHTHTHTHTLTPHDTHTHTPSIIYYSYACTLFYSYALANEAPHRHMHARILTFAHTHRHVCLHKRMLAPCAQSHVPTRICSRAHTRTYA